jgi:hypothetical protein
MRIFCVRVVTDIRADFLRVIQFLLIQSAIESVKKCERLPHQEGHFDVPQLKKGQNGAT